MKEHALTFKILNIKNEISISKKVKNEKKSMIEFFYKMCETNWRKMGQIHETKFRGTIDIICAFIQQVYL